ncbi:hypothetical protein KC980_01230 [candidate division WWE3 bacterium]|uniref:Uncharacterized protein n=1 Tax=candidate division WWE3 bacterium TaxID=2053526 RepID=A0A955EB10_UNCKA|nr:hypothetical protein [candidate division WWE3 bacterium]
MITQNKFKTLVILFVFLTSVAVLIPTVRMRLLYEYIRYKFNYAADNVTIIERSELLPISHDFGYLYTHPKASFKLPYAVELVGVEDYGLHRLLTNDKNTAVLVDLATFSAFYPANSFDVSKLSSHLQYVNQSEAKFIDYMLNIRSRDLKVFDSTSSSAFNFYMLMSKNLVFNNQSLTRPIEKTVMPSAIVYQMTKDLDNKHYKDLLFLRDNDKSFQILIISSELIEQEDVDLIISTIKFTD